MSAKPRTQRSYDLLTQERLDWVADQAKRIESSDSEVLRRLVDAAMLDPEAHPPSEPEPELEPREKFLKSVRQWYTLELAAEKAGLSWREVERWLRSRSYLRDVQGAQWVFLADVEHRLLQVGQYGKGNALALDAFLKAHHPFYGRAKQEELMRGWARLQDDLLDCLSEEFGPQQAEALERAIKRFEQRKEVRLATRT